MQSRSLNRGFGTALLIFLLAAPAGAQESGDDSRVAEALRITTEAAKLYQFEIAGEQSHPLKLHPDSILRWSNPVAGEVYGNVFVWTHHGRPEVIGSIFQWFSPETHGSHEFHSLATGPLEGIGEGKSNWISPTAGIEFSALPDAPQVAESATVRSRQVRAMSRRFHLQKTDRKDVTRDLRLLTQPIFRYGDGHPDVLDGSLFVFVQGTDPEVFLMIEARKAGDQWQWQYGLARMNSVKFVATYLNKEVWRTEIWPWGKVKNHREVYTSFGPFERETTNE